jgi:hypothetical protein
MFWHSYFSRGYRLVPPEKRIVGELVRSGYEWRLLEGQGETGETGETRETRETGEEFDLFRSALILHFFRELSDSFGTN